MMIAVDIGNTNVTWGVFEGKRLHPLVRTPTSSLVEEARAAASLREAFGGAPLKKFRGCDVYGCSVVPQATGIARDIVRTLFESRLILAGEDVAIPILNRYRIPSQVGCDRLVNAYAGLKIFGPGLIIVDFGTAVTFDVVSRRSEYMGGLIFPGFRLMQESLSRSTALLPYAELARPIETIGRDTVASIRSGLVYGMAAACDGVIERLLKKEARGYKVIVTGGDAVLVRPHSLYLKIYEESLVLRGLKMIADSQKSGGLKKNS